MIGFGGLLLRNLVGCCSGAVSSRVRDSLRDATLTFGQSFPLLSPGGGVWF